jgi:pimeloyl-ACP methyl ester carboxylesterase
MGMTQPELGPRAGKVDWSSREDLKLGIREEAEFFGPHDLKLFGCRHTPMGEVIGGLVICCPLHAEFQRNYRREVVAARSLASAGIAVQRFHYRGQGNSEGSSEGATFESMLEDTLAAVERLRTATGVAGIAFAGTRLGALIASAAASEFQGAPLVVWEPVAHAKRYFNDIFRARSIGDYRGGTDRSGHESPKSELLLNGSIDVLGYGIDLPFYESVRRRSMVEELGDSPRPVLICQIGRAATIRTAHTRLASQLQDKGFGVDTEGVIGEETWWFANDPTQARKSLVNKALAEATTGWLSRLFLSEVAA